MRHVMSVSDYNKLYPRPVVPQADGCGGSIYSDIVDCTGLSPDETRQLNRKRKPRKQPPDPGPDLFG
jgi:hypothetical protein